MKRTIPYENTLQAFLKGVGGRYLFTADGGVWEYQGQRRRVTEIEPGGDLVADMRPVFRFKPYLVVFLHPDRTVRD